MSLSVIIAWFRSRPQSAAPPPPDPRAAALVDDLVKRYRPHTNKPQHLPPSARVFLSTENSAGGVAVIVRFADNSWTLFTGQNPSEDAALQSLDWHSRVFVLAGVVPSDLQGAVATEVDRRRTAARLAYMQRCYDDLAKAGKLDELRASVAVLEREAEQSVEKYRYAKAALDRG